MYWNKRICKHHFVCLSICEEYFTCIIEISLCSGQFIFAVKLSSFIAAFGVDFGIWRRSSFSISQINRFLYSLELFSGLYSVVSKSDYLDPVYWRVYEVPFQNFFNSSPISLFIEGVFYFI